MNRNLETAGERIAIVCALPWVDELIDEATGRERNDMDSGAASVAVHVESTNRPFDTTAWEPLTRGAWRLRDEVVIEDVCSSGFDLHVGGGPDHAELRWLRGSEFASATWLPADRPIVDVLRSSLA